MSQKKCTFWIAVLRNHVQEGTWLPQTWFCKTAIQKVRFFGTPCIYFLKIHQYDPRWSLPHFVKYVEHPDHHIFVQGHLKRQHWWIFVSHPTYNMYRYFVSVFSFFYAVVLIWDYSSQMCTVLWVKFVCVTQTYNLFCIFLSAAMPVYIDCYSQQTKGGNVGQPPWPLVILQPPHFFYQPHQEEDNHDRHDNHNQSTTRDRKNHKKHNHHLRQQHHHDHNQHLELYKDNDVRYCYIALLLNQDPIMSFTD